MVERHALAERFAASDSDRKRISTQFGTVHRDPRAPSSLRVTGNVDQVSGWARRPGARWPCATLPRVAQDRGTLAFHLWNGNIEDRWPRAGDIDGTELGAWLDDVLSDALDTLAETAP